ncbi:MAG: VWA domain-containing protein [Deltaproteobacteria bacterium]|nr:VWA domain-containing protein [Deltaproteobacteria bacterium]
MDRRLLLALLLALGAVVLASCATKGTPIEDGGAGFDSSVMMMGDTGVRAIPDANLAACTTSNAEVMEGFAPVDIIYIVDSSGSMSNEAERVQENMNAFSAALGTLDLDYRVVMITTSSFVSVPPPLGTSDRYMLIDRPVSSSEALQALLDEYPTYSSFLRRSAITHFVVVTDDESSLPADSFLTQMRTNLMRNFTFHAIASEMGPTSFTNPDGACQTSTGFPPEGAASPGLEYYALARTTGGLTFSICTPAAEWGGLFTNLTAAIAVPRALPCRYEVPAAPDGMSLDPFRVNVVYTSGAGTEEVVPYVGGTPGTEPDCTSGGWYYEDADSEVVLICPNSCTAIETDMTGRIELAFGCATLLI